MYFHPFPTIKYDPTGSGYTTEIQDIMTRVAVKKWVRNKAAAFAVYGVPNGATPDQVAFFLYNDTEYHWVVLMFNEIFDSYYGWPLGVQDFERFVTSKYTDPMAVHHYEISQTSGDTTKKINVGTVNTDYPAATAVTNFEYEEAEQDKKRKIRLLDPAYVAIFSEEYSKLMSESVF